MVDGLNKIPRNSKTPFRSSSAWEAALSKACDWTKQNMVPSGYVKIAIENGHL